MIGDCQDIHCTRCGKYLFTESVTQTGYHRNNDNSNYTYDEVKDEFICNDCEEEK